MYRRIKGPFQYRWRIAVQSEPNAPKGKEWHERENPLHGYTHRVNGFSFSYSICRFPTRIFYGEIIRTRRSTCRLTTIFEARFIPLKLFRKSKWIETNTIRFSFSRVLVFWLHFPVSTWIYKHYQRNSVFRVNIEVFEVLYGIWFS